MEGEVKEGMCVEDMWRDLWRGGMEGDHVSIHTRCLIE